MPNIHTELVDTRKAKRFALLDFCSSFWQAPLHKDGQPLYAFITPEGIVMPTRASQGGCSFASNFQEGSNDVFLDFCLIRM